MDAKGTLWQVGRYEILCELGRGGMAAVYLARQTDLDREVALKELSGLYARDPSFLERFLRESRVAGSMNHPNIVTVHDYFEHEGTPYIAMEFVDGGSIRPVVTTLTLPQVFGVLEQLCSALAHAEATGIVHRDLKPENVLVTAQGTVKIADFGIAKAINDAAPGRFVTGTGMMLGTPTYMAPEQALATDIGPWSDLYSLGVMSYEMLVGHVPFHETTTPMAILVKHMNEEIPPPRTVNPSLDPQLSSWIERLLVKEPANRTRRASDAWEELEEIVLSLLGPRWRREARLPVSRLTGQTMTSLTPAEIREESPETGAAEEDSLTLLAGGAAAGAAAAAPPPPTDVTPPPAAAGAPPPTDVTPAAAAPQAAAPVEAASPVDATRLETAPPVQEQVAPPRAPAVPEPVAAPPPAPPATPPAPPAPPPVPSTPSLPPPRRTSRRKLLLAAGALGAVVVAAVVIVLVVLGGGDDESGATGTQPADVQTTPTATTSASETTPVESEPVEPAPPAPLPETEHVGVAAGSDALIVSDPDGRVAALDPATLEQVALLADPALPGAVVSSGSDIVVADDQAVTVYGAGFAPKGSARFGPEASLAAAGGTVAAVRGTGTGEAEGQLCVLSGTKLDPCLDLAFEQAGVGVTSDGSGILVANSSDEPALVPYELEGKQLVEQNWVRLDVKPTGAPAEFRGSAYVPVEGGVAVIDLAAGSVSATIPLPATPAAVAVASSSGNLFAALPGTNQVAVVDTLDLEGEPALVPAGEQPAVLSTSDQTVYVLNAGDGTLTRLDALTGDAIGTDAIQALNAAAPAPITATEIALQEDDETVTATIRLEGGRISAAGIVVRNDGLSTGQALVEIWQGGITSTAGEQSLADLTVAIGQKLGRLVVTVTAPDGAFESFEARRTENGKAVTLVATKTPPAATTESSSSSSSSSSDSSTEPAPEPEPEPEPGITVG